MKTALTALAFLTLPLHAAVPILPLPPKATLRFIVAGDAGTGDPHLHDGVLALAKKVHIDAILLAGDNVYPCGVKSPEDANWKKVDVNFADAGIPIYPVLGNHDYGDPTRHGATFTICDHPSPQAQIGATGVVPYWDFPERTYALRSPLVQIVMTDTQPLASDWSSPFLGSATATEETSLVDSALGSSQALWRIVVGHHTIFSSGMRGRAVHTEEKHLREKLLPLLRKHNVDLYVCGHDHDAELIGSLKRKGGEPLFLVSGNGAASTEMERRSAAGEPPTIFPRTFPPPPLIGFSLLEITPHALSITFYDGEGNPRSETYVVRDR